MATKPTKRRSTSESIPPQPPAPLDPDMMYTFREAAQHLRVTERQIKRWVYSDLIHGTPLPGGRSTRITGEELLRVKESGRSERRPPVPPPRVKIRNRTPRSR